MTSEKPGQPPHAHPSGKPYHHGNLREALLTAAVEAIEAHGVPELKLRDLARRVGVSHGAPANHFRDRQALLVALATQGFEMLIAAQAEVLEDEHPSPVEALNALGVAYVEFSVTHRAHFEVMFQREVLSDPDLVAVAARSFQVLMGAIGEVRTAGGSSENSSKGRIAEDTALGAMGSWALVHGLATLHAGGLLPSAICDDLPKLSERILEAMVRLGDPRRR